ncbi:MAG: DNA-processing protein DprA [Pseudomonadota bacterium]
MADVSFAPAETALLPAAGGEHERLARLRLARSRNVGPRSFMHLIRRYGSAVAAIEALPAQGSGYSLCDIATARAELEAGSAAGARLVLIGEAEYPDRLTTIPGPPPVLWLQGSATAFSGRAIAIVGARNASAIGQRLARRLALSLAADGVTVVSGLARGIDTAAHEGTIAAATGAEDGQEPGPTIAVLAGGIDVIYPAENGDLAERIVVEGGALISECPPGTIPAGRHFPRRNRLVSGLSDGVVLVEAALRSGSMITARSALEQGREVMACPGSPEDPRTGGCNALIREGAALIRTAADVMDALTLPRRLAPPPDGMPAGMAEGPEPFDYGLSGLGSEPFIDEEGEDAPLLTDRVLALLSPTPVEVDEIARACRSSPASLSLALLELELAGRLVRVQGGQIAAVPA